MSTINFPGGVWPVMMTPFFENGDVDYEALTKMTDWYIRQGSDGLFAICQSSEMYQMTVDERVDACACVVKAAGGRVPVIASAMSEDIKVRAEEVKRLMAAGASAVILITNQYASQEEEDTVWMERCEAFLQMIPEDIPLGFYECPYPYKRLIATENLKRCADTGRFYFLKDTCCDERLIEERLQVISGSNLKLYNANTTTLLASMRAGAAGFSGVMANFHTDLYAFLYAHRNEEIADYVQSFLSIASLIERQYYPCNAKYHMQKYSGIPLTLVSRRQDYHGLTDTFKMEVDMLHVLEKKFHKELGI